MKAFAELRSFWCIPNEATYGTSVFGSSTSAENQVIVMQIGLRPKLPWLAYITQLPECMNYSSLHSILVIV